MKKSQAKDQRCFPIWSKQFWFIAEAAEEANLHQEN